MDNNLLDLTITTQSVLYLALAQICTVCQDTPEELQECNLNESKNYAETVQLLKSYLF